MAEEVDLIAFGAHPDDLELSCGGTLVKCCREGYKLVMVDLTRGEAATNGDPTTRSREAEQAREVIGAYKRVNLGLPDCGLSDGRGWNDYIKEIVKVIRLFKPKIVLCPHERARHPDHSATSTLVRQAVFFAGVGNFHTDLGSRHSVCLTIYYLMRYWAKPSFVVDISDFYDDKLKAIKCYQSQLFPQISGGQETLVGSETVLADLSARDMYTGSLIGVKYGEAFICPVPIPLSDPIQAFTSSSVAKSAFFE